MMTWSVVLTLVALAGLLFSEVRQWQAGRWVAKPLASSGFVALALAGHALASTFGRVVLVALLLSWCGDVLLIVRRRAAFVAGLGCFLFAHVAFAVAFVLRGIDAVWLLCALVALVPPVIVVWRWLRPHLPASLVLPVFAYVVVITAMVACVVGMWGAGGAALLVVAALAFYLSDLAVARERFVTKTIANKLWGLPLYYVAQLLFAAFAGVWAAVRS